MVKPTAKFSFMEEWKEYQLKDATTVLGDGLHGTPKYDENGTVFFINGNNLVDGKIEIKESTKRVSEDEANKYKKNLNSRTILVSINGTIGNVAKYQGEACILGKSACYFNVSEDFDLNFIYYVVASKQFKNSITHLSTGTTIKNVSLETMRNYSFAAPSINEQKRIAELLSSLDDKIELNRRINDNLEQQAQALFKSWFVDFEPFRDGEFVDSGLGMIPEGWSIICFNDFLTPSSQRTLQENIPEYSVTNTGIIPRDSKFKKQLSKSTSKNKILRKNNLVFGMSREILNWGIMYDEIGSVSSAYNVYIIDDLLVNPTYLKYYMTANIDYFKDLIGTAAREGQALDKGALVQKQICIPPYEILDDFLTRENGYKYKVDKLNSEIINLTNMRDLLLPKLMSGELKINDLNC